MSTKISCLPKQRSYFDQKPMTIKAFSPTEKDYTELPNPVRDTIAADNTAWQEFDYTYDDLDNLYDDPYDDSNTFD